MRLLILPFIIEVSDPEAADVVPLTKVAFQNGQRIVAAAVAVEKELEKIINARIAGDHDGVNEFFAEYILAADWFTFATKRKLAMQIIDDAKALTGSDKSSFEKLSRKVMTLRNRFAHGVLGMHGGVATISYFGDGKRQTDELTDDYWTEVEDTFEQVLRLIVKAQPLVNVTGGGWGFTRDQKT